LAKSDAAWVMLMVLGIAVLDAPLAQAQSSAPPVATGSGGGLLANPADEGTDFGVAPRDGLQDDLAAPTPLAIPGGKVITTAAAREAVGSTVLFIDVWQTGPHLGIPGSATMPGAGRGGNFADALQARLGSALALLTGHDLNHPLIFLCTDVRCWEAYNAALRAIHLGYRSVGWYRGGLAAWHAAGLRLAMVGQIRFAARPPG